MNLHKFSHRWIRIAFSIIAITSILVGCRLPWQPDPDAQESEAPISKETQEIESDLEGITTAVPREDLPPALVEVTPPPTSFIALDESITLYFNQAMDTGSVEAAINFEPRINGRFTWEADQILTFTPDQTLPVGRTLNLIIDTSAQAANRQSLQEEIALNFQTAEPLRVIQTMPANDAQDVDPESVVFVAFNQPVVPLGAEADYPPAFTLYPEVLGQGEWLNTSTYRFTPAPSMNGGTSYTLQLDESLKAVSNAGFESSQVLETSFTTTAPRVSNVLPLAEERLRLDGPIQVVFNMRMDSESVEENFELFTSDGLRVDGDFEWDQDFKTATFRPNNYLERDKTYTIRLGEGANSFGGLPISDTLQITRTTFPEFSVDPGILPEFSSYYDDYGQYSIIFSTPIDAKTYQDHITIFPEVHSRSLYLYDDDQSFNLSGYFSPETEYTLTLDADFQDVWGQPLGEERMFTFTTPPSQPSLSVVSGRSSYNLVFIPSAASEIVLQATNITTLTMEIAPITIQDLKTLLHPDNYDYRQIFLPENREVSTQELDLTKNVSEVIRLPLSYQEQPLKSGIYFLQVTSPEIDDEWAWLNNKFYLIVSENNLVMKTSMTQAFVWASQLSDYAPVSNAPVTIFTADGERLAEGMTDQAGIFKDALTGFDEPYVTIFAILGEPGQSDFGFSISSWDQELALYEMGINLNVFQPTTDAYIYTDRPIYRPGDSVYFKALVFSRENGQPVRSDLNEITVSIYGDPGLSGVVPELYSEDLVLSPYGTVDGEVVLPQEGSTGLYYIELREGERVIETLYFDVAAYRKPEIELEVLMEQAEMISGEDLVAEVQADYYFGLPATEEILTWNLFQDDQYFHLPGYRVGPVDTSWLAPRMRDYSIFGEFIASGEGKTNEEGHFTLRLSPQALAQDTQTSGKMQEYTLETTIVDESGFRVSQRESILVHPEDFYIGVQPDAYFGAVDTPFTFSILTVNWDKQAAANIDMDATFEKISWEVEETGDPTMPYRYVSETTFVGSTSPVTGSDGKAKVSFTPSEPGTYQISLEAGDALTQMIVWVTSASGAVWPRETQNQITLTADSTNYQPGQIAQVFIPNPFAAGAKALITIERGLVMDSQVIDVQGDGYTLAIPITAESIPNFYLSVMLFGRNAADQPDFRQGTLNLSVAPISKNLNVELLLDPLKTEPGRTVSATLKITDQQGNPIQGEFSIAVVDKAVLALVESSVPPILEAFYGERPLSVQTSFSLRTYATQLSLSALDVGGQGGGGDMAYVETPREEFPDTALWEASVVTGADGTAKLEIPLPDSLTTWDVKVRGLTESYLVGETQAEIVTQKDLMIQPVTPRFLVDGDIVQLAAVVHNNTGQDLDVVVSLQGAGFIFNRDSLPSQSIRLAAGRSSRVTWWGQVTGVEALDLVFEASSNGFTDASKPVWGDLKVMRYVMPHTFSTTGQLDAEGQRLELVSLPMTTDTDFGDIAVELYPSLIPMLIESLQALENISYDDIVSKLSRFLANLETYLALNNLGIDLPQLESDLEALVKEGVRQLLAAQNFDGGWTWRQRVNYDESPSDPFITAYVLIGLQRADEVGFDVGDYVIDRGVESLYAQLLSPAQLESTWQLDQLAFQVYALRQQGLNLHDQIDSLYDRRSELNPWAVALVCLSVEAIEGRTSRVNTLLSDLESRAVRSATGVYWESEGEPGFLPGTPIYNTAVALYALSQLDPASTSVPLALQFLLKQRNSDALWMSNFDSAWTLQAIASALQGTGDYQADFDFQVALNDMVIAEGSAQGTEVATGTSATASLQSLYPNAPNALLIERGEGRGTLYYRADLNTYHAAATAKALDRGINLQRAYYIAGEGCPSAEGCAPIDSIKLDPDDPSQMITVALTAIVPHDMYHFMLEDFIPAGTEILNEAYLTSQTLIETTSPAYNPYQPFEHGWGWWYFNEPQTYDDHILWTADYLPAGTYTLLYTLVPYQRGAFQVLPGHAWQYFYPEVQGTTFGDLFTIN